MQRTRQTLAVSALFALPLLTSQLQAEEKPIFTYVTEWRVPRAKNAAFAAYFEKNSQPVLDRLMADNTITEWGRTSSLIHSEEGMTDAFWWCATSNAGALKVLAELRKLDQAPLGDIIEKHRDQFLESMVFRTGSSKAEAGYLQTSDYFVKPGKAGEWFELFKKWNQPILEKLLADGTIMGYGIDRESFHSHDPGMRSFWMITETAEAMDKVDAAFDAAEAKRSPEEQKAISSAMSETTQPGTHRDGLSLLVRYHHK